MAKSKKSIVKKALKGAMKEEGKAHEKTESADVEKAEDTVGKYKNLSKK